MSHLLSFPDGHFKSASQSPLASKKLPFDPKTSQLSLFPADPIEATCLNETWKTLPNSASCGSNRLPSIPLTDRNLSPDNTTTIIVPVEVPFKRPPLTTLNLSNSHIKSFPNEILKLSSLSVLNLSHNHLESLPEIISNLVNLESLDLSFNCLKSLPKTLNKLNKLAALFLESNSLTQIGDEVTSLPSLRILNLVHNSLETFPTSFCNLGYLTTFSLEWFSYTNPELDVHQRGTEGSQTIASLISECRRQQKVGKHSITFQNFISFFTQIDDNESSDQSTLLHRACYNGDSSVINHLIEGHCSMLDQEDSENMTPLCISLLQNNTETALTLLKKGANFRKPCGYYGYPLLIAAKKGNTTIVKALLDLGEDPNRKDTAMNTAMHHAVVMLADGNIKAMQMIQLLIDSGADPNILNKDKWTPFHLAIRKKNAKAIQWLLDYNSEMKEVHGRDEVFNINKRGGPYKWTPLHIAAYANLPELVELLAAVGANVFKRNAFGYTTKSGVSKPGISLTLGQKYEKEMIKRHFEDVAKKQKLLESTNMRLRIVEDDKSIRMASKNRFEENTHIRDSLLEEQFLSAKFQVAYPKKKVRSNPRWQSCQMGRIGEEDFQDTPLQPTEPSHRGHQPAQSISIKSSKESYPTDFDENMTTDARLYINSIPNFGNRAKLIDKTKRIQRPEKSSEYLSKIDMSTYKLKLLKNLDFDYDFCKKELRAFRENLASNELLVIDKLKVFLLLRRLHETMLDYIYRSYNVPVSKKQFAKYLSTEILSNKRLDIGCKNDDISRPKISQIVEFSNLLPEELIKAFKVFNGDKHERTMLKVHVCRLLCELKNLVGLKFLIKVVKDPLEYFIVKREAQNAIEVLKAELLGIR